MRKLAAFGLVALLGNASLAAPVRIKNGSTVFVSVKGKRQAGVGLRPKNGAWRVDLGGAKDTDGGTVELVDITEGANNAKWVLSPEGGALTLDGQRFIAGHAYRVTVMRNAVVVATALVYLYPPTVTGKTKVSFDGGESVGADSDDIAIEKKPSP
jgi:hypothetical protein